VAEHLEYGRTAERIARTRLEQRGLGWVESNYRCRFGEVDLIMTERRTLVVVEVRYRRQIGVVHPARSVTHEKIRRIVRTTEHFLQHHRRWRGTPVRFDIVGLYGPLDDAGMKWIRGAFTIDDLADRI